jgi:amino acid transporter
MAMILVLLTYGGWNEAAYLSAEVRDTRRNMVRVLVYGTVAIALLYLLINVAYLSTLGLAGLRASEAVAADLMRLAVGEAGAIVLNLLICAAALSTLNASIFTGARVFYALGQDLPLLQRLGLWNERGSNPRNGILVQGVIALALVALGAATRDGFQAMVEYTAPVFWSFMLLTGISLFVLRRQAGPGEVAFRVPLYPLTPILFCLSCAYLLYSSIVYTGVGALVGIAVLLAGTPLLFAGRRRVAAAE